MNKLTYILWAFAAHALNNFVDANPQAPPTFRRGTDEIKLVRCDADRPGWAMVETPAGKPETVQLADGELGQLVTNYGRATGQKIELPSLVGYETEHATSAAAAGTQAAGGGYGQP